MVVIEKCEFTKVGIVNIVFSRTVGLERLLLLIKRESERYAGENRRMFQTTFLELWAFLGINILMGINKLPKMRDYWSDEEGLGNIIQKTMTRDIFLEILQNIHFSNILQQHPPKDSENYDLAWKLQPFFDDLMQHFVGQNRINLSMRIYMCKFRGRSLMHQYIKNTPIRWEFKFWF